MNGEPNEHNVTGGNNAENTQPEADLAGSTEFSSYAAFSPMSGRAFEKRALYAVLTAFGTACMADLLFQIFCLGSLTDLFIDGYSYLADKLCALRFGAYIEDAADDIFYQIYDIASYTFMMLSQICIFSVTARILRNKGFVRTEDIPETDGGERSFTVRNILPIMFFSLFASMMFSWLVSIVTGDFSTAEEAFPTTDVGTLLYYASLAFFPPLLEEIAFRGVLQRSLLPYGKRFAVVVSAAVFASMHSGFSGMAYAFVSGIFYGIAAANTGSLVPGIIMHVMNNSIVFADELLAESFPQYTDIIPSASNLVYFFFGFVSLYVLFGRKKKLSLSDGCKGELTERERFSLTANPFLILYFGVMVFFALSGMFY